MPNEKSESRDKKSESVRLRTVIEGMVLATLGFLAITTFNISTKVSEVKVLTESQAKRVDRIANRLPDLGVRIANEELRRPFDIAVLTSKPFERKGIGKFSRVNILDPRTSKRFELLKKLDSGIEKLSALSILGFAMASHSDFITAKQVVSYAVMTDSPEYQIMLPTSLDESASFLIRNSEIDGNQYAKRLSMILGTSPKEYKLNVSTRSLRQLFLRQKELIEELGDQDSIILFDSSDKKAKNEN